MDFTAVEHARHTKRAGLAGPARSEGVMQILPEVRPLRSVEVVAIRALEQLRVDVPAVYRGEIAVAAGVRLQAVAVVAEVRGRLLYSIAEIAQIHLRRRG